MGKLDGRRIAIIATDGFEESELTSPRAALEREGARTEVLSLHEGVIRGWRDGNWSGEVRVDHLVADALCDDYDALLVPGGVMNPDALRQERDVVALVQEFFDGGKPIGSICHGPQVLLETGELEGRRVTSYPSLKTDLVNAGAEWVDEEVVEDENLITSRRPSDLPAFNEKIIEAFREFALAPPGDGLEQPVDGASMPMPASFASPRLPRRRAKPSRRGSPARPGGGRGAMARNTPRPRGKRPKALR